MIAIDDLAYRSKLAKIDPKSKLIFSLVPLICCLLAKSISVSGVTLLVMSFVTLQYSAVSLKRYLRFLMIPGIFLLFGTIAVIFSEIPKGTSILIGISLGTHLYGVTAASLFFGGRLILRALSCVSCVYFLSFNTPMNALFALLEKSRLPATIVSLMELIYRYIFVIWEEAAKMLTAQQSRLGYQNFKGSLHSMGALAAGVFIRAYQRCSRTEAALESRGYQEGRLITLSEESMPCRNLFLLAFLFFLILLFFEIGERLLFS